MHGSSADCVHGSSADCVKLGSHARPCSSPPLKGSGLSVRWSRRSGGAERVAVLPGALPAGRRRRRCAHSGRPDAVVWQAGACTVMTVARPWVALQGVSGSGDRQSRLTARPACWAAQHTLTLASGRAQAPSLVPSTTCALTLLAPIGLPLGSSARPRPELLLSLQASLFFSTGELTLGYSAVTSATAISQVPPGLQAGWRMRASWSTRAHLLR